MKSIALKTISVYAAFSVLPTCYGLAAKVYKKSGDFIVGGLVGFHINSANTGECGSIHTIGALRRGEAIAYATSKIDDDPEILNGFTLGYEIYDVCGSQEQTLKHALLFLPPFRDNNDVVGIVGPERSSSSIQATNILGLYNISLVSYLSTSDELSNSDRFPYFLRTVPPDKFQVSAIIDILVYFNWTYVGFIYSDDSYGRNAEVEFQAQAKENNICVAYSHKLVFPGRTGYNISLQGTIRRLIELKESSLLSVAILFLQVEVVKDFFVFARDEGIDRDFIWIGSDGWGLFDLEPVIGSELTALGAFTIIPKSAPDQQFEAYFQTSLTSTSNNNPWLPEFSTNRSLCELNRTMCTFDEDPGLSFASVVIDSVEVLARGLDAMKKEKCTDSMNVLTCRNILLSNRRLLRDYLLNVTFTNSSSNGTVAFTTDGDAKGQYQIRYLNQAENNTYDFDDVGTWTETGNDPGLKLADVDWYLERDESPRGSIYSENNVPKSVCSDPCGPLQVQSSDILECCWTCSSCKDNEIIVNNECVSCFIEENRTYMWPDETRSYCRHLDNVKLRDEVAKVLPLLFAILGLVASINIAYLYIKHRNKRLIKASSRELGYIVLMGVFLSYLSAILYSTPPVKITCFLRRIVPHIATSFIYVSLATMTIRLYRIFRSGKKTTKRPKFVSPVTQVMITLVLSLLPLSWGITWILVEPPGVNIIKPTAQRQVVEMMCVVSMPHRIGQLCWDLFVVSICCVLAVLARKLPANYNQLRFITFCVFSTLVVYIAFAPAFFTSRNSNQQDLYTAIGAIIQSTVVLILIFGVKVGAIYMVKEEDQHVVTTISGTVTQMKNGLPSKANSNTEDSRETTVDGDTKKKTAHVLPAPCPDSPTISIKRSYDIATQTCETDATTDRVYISDGYIRTFPRSYDSESIEISFDKQYDD